MSLKLRDLIRQVRACKTAAEERAVIAKESAMIRTAIREEQIQYRHRNVAKLLFMHMLGYPTHFGQLECLKLIASPRFPEKRIGYLGLLLLLSEQADVLMLATNSLKNDLSSSNKFVTGLSLCTIGNLATPDMSRDLCPEVDKHLKASSPYLRKKACLAMSRCLVKCPELLEDYVERLVTLLNDRSHGVLVTVVQLMTQVLLLEKQPKVKEALLRLVPSLVKLMRNLLNTSSYDNNSTEGISDPFLQTQILTLLRILGKNNVAASEEMNDVLAQVATNTETSKNAGNAILYECVQTIMAIECEESLRVLAVNILGRFLLNRDNNIRYVALNTLSSCVVNEANSEGPNTASSALQRHRTTIVDCLKDPDISIRQRALELIYHLVNNENVEDLTAELLNYLVLCPREHRTDICTRVLRVVEKYSPDDRWRVDTLITMLTIAGRECSHDVQNATIVYISRSSEDLRAYATHKLLKAVRDDDGSQRGLLVVGIWCVGEYGDLILEPYSYEPPSSNGNLQEVLDASKDDITAPISISFMGLEPQAIVKTIEDIIGRHTCPEDVHVVALTCFVKLSDRLKDVVDDSTKLKLRKLLDKNKGSHILELQLRSCEYGALVRVANGEDVSPSKPTEDLFGATGSTVNASFMAVAKEALARMPAVDFALVNKKKEEDAKMMGEDFFDQKESKELPTSSKTNAEPSLLDLDDIFGGAPTAPTKQPTKKLNGISSATAPKAPEAKGDMDLLADIFSAPSVTTTTAVTPAFDPFSGMSAPAPMPTPTPAVTDLFATAPAPTAPNSPPTPINNPSPVNNLTAPTSNKNEPILVPGFSKSGLEVTFLCTKTDGFNPQHSELVAKFKNTTDDSIYGLSMQVAVPKFVKMKLCPPTSTTIPVSGTIGTTEVTQTVQVTNTLVGSKNLVLKVKLTFTSKGEKVEYIGTCSGFPAGKF